MNLALFYLHHTFIDKIWADWQRLDTTGRRSTTMYGVSGESVNDRMQPWNVPVSSVMDTSRLCCKCDNIIVFFLKKKR